MSFKDAQQKKNYYFSLNSFPASVVSFGYNTDVMYSADYRS